ncbi:MAG TPA: pyruvate kinase [Candidatus Nanoarchaeia archaeon]|nr:pyruvate kinase [Candidatus Nanoarchaeia archaeon]
MTTSKAQIVATIGALRGGKDELKELLAHQVDVVRLNFSWSDLAERVEQIAMVREVAEELGRRIPIIEDLPGPRIQKEKGHTYDAHAEAGFTEHDRELVAFGVAQGVDYFAVSFVAGPEDIEACRETISKNGGNQKIIAKIERKMALESLESIISAADAIMIARGDLGSEIPLEKIPFVQANIITRCNNARKPVITATQMLLSMVDNPVPTRAEVTDVANAILQGSDAVMLSEETAIGKHPVEAVIMMEKIIVEAEKHLSGRARHVHKL